MTSLRAAEQLDQAHLSSPAVTPMIDAARIFYVEGYMLSHGFSCVLELGMKATLASKVGADPAT